MRITTTVFFFALLFFFIYLTNYSFTPQVVEPQVVEPSHMNNNAAVSGPGKLSNEISETTRTTAVASNTDAGPSLTGKFFFSFLDFFK